MYTEEEIRQHRLAWIEELETTDRRQGVGALHVKRITDEEVHEFCCLGIACEVAIANGLELEVHEGEMVDSVTQYRYGAGGDVGLLPPEVQEWLGVESQSPRLGASRRVGQSAATELNDTFRFTFRRIAARAREMWGLQ